MPKRNHLAQVGRVCLVNHGPDSGKICCILDIVDQNRALVDGPADITGISRQTLSFRNLALTPILIEISRSPRPATLRAAMTKNKVVEQWTSSNWATKLRAQRLKKTLSDFDRFKGMLAKKQRNTLVNREFAKLKRQPQPKRKIKKSVQKKADIEKKEAEDKKKALEKARADLIKRQEKEKAEKAADKGKAGKGGGDDAPKKKK
jgi:large subunit ribosomal protein L14e